MNRRMVIFSSGALTILTLGLAACGSSDAKTDQGEPAKQELAVSVHVQTIQPTQFAEIIQVTGIVKAYEDVLLSAEEGGVIQEWKVPKGASVLEGDILALLKDDVLRASYEAAEAQYKLSALNYEKQVALYHEKAISELQVKSAEYNRDVAKAQADLMKARLERTRLRSPINGVLNDRFFDEGEFAPPAVTLAHLVNAERVKVVAEVPEMDVPGITIGSTARFTIDAFPDDTLSGKVSFVAAAINPNNRTLPVEVVVANPRGKLKPEMIARMKIVRSQRSNALMVNQSIVQQVDRDKYVVYVEEKGKAQERVVKLGTRQGNFVEIIKGLKSGDRVIVRGYQKLVDGQTVTVTSS